MSAAAKASIFAELVKKKVIEAAKGAGVRAWERDVEISLDTNDPTLFHFTISYVAKSAKTTPLDSLIQKKLDVDYLPIHTLHDEVQIEVPAVNMKGEPLTADHILSVIEHLEKQPNYHAETDLIFPKYLQKDLEELKQYQFEKKKKTMEEMGKAFELGKQKYVGVGPIKGTMGKMTIDGMSIGYITEMELTHTSVPPVDLDALTPQHLDTAARKLGKVVTPSGQLGMDL